MNLKAIIVLAALCLSSTTNAQMTTPRVNPTVQVAPAPSYCASAAAREVGLSTAQVLALDKAQFHKQGTDCTRYRDSALLFAAALADSKGDERQALSRIHAGPAGAHMKKAVFRILANRRAELTEN